MNLKEFFHGLFDAGDIVVDPRDNLGVEAAWVDEEIGEMLAEHHEYDSLGG